MGNSAEAWHELFVATAGADAALAGLVFVAVSINLDRILHLDGVPERALQTLTLLVGVVLVSFLGLTPQSSTALGIEIVVLGAALLALFARTLRATVRSVLGKPSWCPSAWPCPRSAAFPTSSAGSACSRKPAADCTGCWPG